jgi:hypothetical protein
MENNLHTLVLAVLALLLGPFSIPFYFFYRFPHIFFVYCGYPILVHFWQACIFTLGPAILLSFHHFEAI